VKTDSITPYFLAFPNILSKIILFKNREEIVTVYLTVFLPQKIPMVILWKYTREQLQNHVSHKPFRKLAGT